MAERGASIQKEFTGQGSGALHSSLCPALVVHSLLCLSSLRPRVKDFENTQKSKHSPQSLTSISFFSLKTAYESITSHIKCLKFV